jgi:hypothetical protein
MSSDKRFYGIYRGICVDNMDPDEENKITLIVPQVLGNQVTEWAQPCLPVVTNADHPDHKKHLASEVADLLLGHGTHSATFTTSSGGDPAHTHSVAVTFSHTNNHAGKTPDSTYRLDHEHEPTTDTLDKDGSEIGLTAAEHTYHREVPFIGQKVWVMFIAGDPNFPVWMGVSLP